MRCSLPAKGVRMAMVTPWGRFTHAAAKTLAGH
jgi:hypothetical protein